MPHLVFVAEVCPPQKLEGPTFGFFIACPLSSFEIILAPPFQSLQKRFITNIALLFLRVHELICIHYLCFFTSYARHLLFHCTRFLMFQLASFCSSTAIWLKTPSNDLCLTCCLHTPYTRLPALRAHAPLFAYTLLGSCTTVRIYFTSSGHVYCCSHAYV